MSVKILHLSDLHFGKNNKDTELLIADSLNNKNVDYVIITGDIIDASSNDKNVETEIECAVDFLETLRSKLGEYGKKGIDKNRFLFIPGNHDVIRDKDASARHEPYKKFLEKFYGVIPIEYNQDYWSVFKRDDEKKIVFVVFNAVNYPYKKLSEEKDGSSKEEELEKCHGSISTKQLLSQTCLLDAIDNIDEYVVVCFLHYHFYLREERQKSYVDTSYLDNSELFLNKMSKYNTRVILHGHKHTSMNRRIMLNSALDKEEKISTVLGCGSTNKSDAPCNSFHYIEVFSRDDVRELIVEEYEYTNSSFNPNNTIEIPVKIRHQVRCELDSLIDYANWRDSYRKLQDNDGLTANHSGNLFKFFDQTVGSLNDTAIRMSADDKNLL